MKIAFFTDSYFPKIDGVARSVDSFAKELTRLGHEVVVFCPKQEPIGDFANHLLTRSRTQAPSPPPAAAAGFRSPNSATPRSLTHKGWLSSPGFLDTDSGEGANSGKDTKAQEGEGVGRDSQKAGQFPVVRFNSFSYYFQPEVKLSLPTPLTSLRQALQSFDIIHSHSPGPLGILAEEVALLRGVPHIHTFHTMLSDYNHYLFQGRLLSPASIEKLAAFWCNRVDFIVAPSKKVEEHLRAEGVKQPIQIIPSGVDLAQFRVQESNFLQQQGLVKSGEFVFLTVGRLGQEKSVDVILHSFADIVGKVKPSSRRNLRLLVVGDGPERTSLTEKVRQLGISAYTSFAGYINPDLMPQVYAEANVFLFASKTETQGLVVLEAMAAGLPVVAINDGAVAEMVTHGENGFLVEGVFEMAKAMLSLFSPNTPNPLTTQMFQASRQIAQNFSIQKITQKMLEYYEEALESYSAKSRRQKLKRQYQRLKQRLERFNLN